jgi:hypothetical protein
MHTSRSPINSLQTISRVGVVVIALIPSLMIL